ncbi:hypothetical protein [Calothrix rhizosoleniae]|uniref:hypothetical protein n=1 Tax=Calothrix rhizosoleniae TaxID=888997 RepID=UPI000B4A280D|nr:hypothetical protein [Calothrix rhizosoleniae]
MKRLLYEQSVAYKGYLIIPFVFSKADNYNIYSYKLLSAIGNKSKFQKVENPAAIYGSSAENIIDIAKEHLDINFEFINHTDYFQSRYVYRHNLIIVGNENGKYFYDHYPPDSLNNIAAPKLFTSEYECLSWIRQGLDMLHIRLRAS